MGEAGESPGSTFLGLQYVAGSDGVIRPEMASQIMKTGFGHLYDERLAKIFGENLEKLVSGEITPVTLYRLKLDMTDIELGKRTGLGRRTVRRHETPGGFMKATVGQLAAYAKVFGVPLSALFCVVEAGAAQAVEMVEAGRGLVSVLRKAGEKR